MGKNEVSKTNSGKPQNVLPKIPKLDDVKKITIKETSTVDWEFSTETRTKSIEIDYKTKK